MGVAKIAVTAPNSCPNQRAYYTHAKTVIEQKRDKLEATPKGQAKLKLTDSMRVLK